MSRARRRTAAVLITVPAFTAAVLAGPGEIAQAAHANAAQAKAAASATKGDKTAAFYDAREGESAAARKQLAARKIELAASARSKDLNKVVGGQSVVEFDPLTGTPRQVSRLDGYLTEPSKDPVSKIVLDYVKAHAVDFGLSSTDISHLTLTHTYIDLYGGQHLFFTQSVNGVPLFGNGLKANLTKTGRIINIVGSPVSGLAAPSGAANLSASAAVVAAKKDVGAKKTAPTEGDSTMKVLFQTTGGTRAAWRVVAMSLSDPILSVVDATSGRVLYRSSLGSDESFTAPGGSTAAKTTAPAAAAPAAAASTSTDATALVYENYPNAAKGGTAAKVDLTKAGYLAANAKTLSGNNAHTYTDVNDDNEPEASEEVHPGASSFQFPQKRISISDEPCSAYPCTWDPSKPGSWNVNRAQTATQNFYYVNKYHDHLLHAPIGFTEAAGNFQVKNSTGKGFAGDPVLDEPLDGADTAGGLPDLNHIDNANFETPPDGISPRMQMYLFHAPGFTYEEEPFVAASGADEADIVYHEYTHGLSHRLVVDATDVPALDSIQGGSMGEAWSDWYAYDELAIEGLATNSTADGDLRVGNYVNAGVDLFRTQPLDCPVGSTSSKCPGSQTAGHSGGYTYGDFGHVIAGPEVHADGEIWSETLWDVRGTVGAHVAEDIITRGMELSPTYPSMLDMRNAILEADLAYEGGKQLPYLWKAFAKRGMGYFAGVTSGDDIHPVEDFSLPPVAGGATGTISGTVIDSLSKAPLAGASVAIGGHDSGFAGSFSAITASNGTFTITGVPVGTYPDVSAVKPGFDPVTVPVTVTTNTPKQTFNVIRDWASATGGGTITDFDGVDFSDFGCGPGAAIDQSEGTGWGSTSDLDENGQPTADTPKSITIALPKAIKVSSIVIDPANTCGDAGSSSTADYKVETYDGTSWHAAASGVFAPADRGRLNAVSLASGSTTHITKVRFTMIKPQVFEIGGSCPGAFTGCDFMDMSELEVYGS